MLLTAVYTSEGMRAVSLYNNHLQNVDAWLEGLQAGCNMGQQALFALLVAQCTAAKQMRQISNIDFCKATKAITLKMHVSPDYGCEKGAPRLPYPCYTMTCRRVLAVWLVQHSLPDVSYVTTFSDTEAVLGCSLTSLQVSNRP